MPAHAQVAQFDRADGRAHQAQAIDQALSNGYEAGATVVLITVWFLPFGRSSRKPAYSKSVRVPLYRKDVEINHHRRRPSRGPNLRSTEPDLVRQEVWAWLAATQLVRKAAHAATQTTAGISTDQISFTTTCREATRSMVQSLVTATSLPAALTAAADTAARGIISNLVTVDRDRHSPRQHKCRPTFPHTATTKPTTGGPLKLNVGVSPRPDTT